MKKLLIIQVLFISFYGYSQTYNFPAFTTKHGEKGAEWVSYKLTKEMVEADKSRKRPSFKSFKGISPSHYTNSGYDRGHLTGADLFSHDSLEYVSTFSMANISPQAPKLNQQAWKWLEVYEKRLAEKYSCIWVVVFVEYGEQTYKKLHIPDNFVKRIMKCNGEIISEHKFDNI